MSERFRRTEQNPRSRKIVGLILIIIMSVFGIWLGSLGITTGDIGIIVMVIAFAYVLIGAIFSLYMLTIGYSGPTIGPVRRPLMPNKWFFVSVFSGGGAVVFFVYAEYVFQEAPLVFYILAGIQAGICLIAGLIVIILRTKRNEDTSSMEEEEFLDY